MQKITIPDHYNYIALFLTLSCNLKCPYCINLNENGASRKSVVRGIIKPDIWLNFINRLDIKSDDLPLTLQGGEPTLYPYFYELVNGIDDKFKLDLLTNFMFDEDEFIRRINPSKFTRDAKYAAIRVSYHPNQNDINTLIKKHDKMKDAGFYVGIYSVLTPQNKSHIEEVMKKCKDLGIDFRVKEYLGFDGQKWHGSYKFPEAISGNVNKYCDCKTTELLISPAGLVYRCHSDLYEKRAEVADISDPNYKFEDIYRPCIVYGHCNPCDIKVKTNRFQNFGHTSVEIKNIRELNEKERILLENSDFKGALNL
ncbi:radical SAM protein [Campylobacter fetus]|uniref:radical SAM protein n=1 Tax=Campylobacter fetus TaxID=196 RepID=UPI003AF7C55F